MFIVLLLLVHYYPCSQLIYISVSVSLIIFYLARLLLMAPVSLLLWLLLCISCPPLLIRVWLQVVRLFLDFLPVRLSYHRVSHHPRLSGLGLEAEVLIHIIITGVYSYSLLYQVLDDDLTIMLVRLDSDIVLLSSFWSACLSCLL